ncbi:MAG TPA: hypothetical protein VLL03_05070 [Burkholderiales bacterium]|nr:hypothetical protein [Burkholderiales bacterium]
MLTNRNKLSALLLGIMLSFSVLQPALAAEDAKMARNSQQSGDAPCAESKKQFNDNTDKMDSSPDTWYERQSRIPGG